MTKNYNNSNLKDASRIIRDGGGVTSDRHLSGWVRFAHTAPYRKCGFTLAEVLITLAIVGVVAALTMPLLVANHRRSVVEQRLKKFYSVMKQAVMLSEVQNGNIDHWDKLEPGKDEEGNSNSYIWYNKYLAPYISSTKVTIANNEYAPTIVYFADGSLLSFQRYAWYFFPFAKDYKLDANGITDYSISGRKFFVFFWYESQADYEKGCRGFDTFGCNWTDEDLTKENKTNACSETYLNQPATCSRVIQKNGWKIPDNYPFAI